MRLGARDVVEELDLVTVKCSLTMKNSSLYEDTLTFCVGSARKSGIPQIIDDALGMLSLHTLKYFPIDLVSMSKEDKSFFHVDGDSDTEAVLGLNLIQLKKVKEVWNMTEKEKIALASTCKIRGNELLQDENFSRALHAYKCGLQCLEGSVSVKPAAHFSQHPVDADAQQLYLHLLTNAALCLLKIVAQPERVTSRSNHQLVSAETLMRHCIGMCEKALKVDADNAKALYRMAQAQAQLKNYSEAISTAQRAICKLKSKGSRADMVEKSVFEWKELLVTQKRDEYEHVRLAFLKRATELRKQGRLFADDGTGEASRLHFDDWSNELADNVMSIHEELEAFGEKMPDAKTSGSSSSSSSKMSKKAHRLSIPTRLTKIESEDEEQEELEEEAN